MLQRAALYCSVLQCIDDAVKTTTDDAVKTTTYAT